MSGEYACQCGGENPEWDYHSRECCAKTAQAFTLCTSAGPTPRSSKPIPAGDDE